MLRLCKVLSGNLRNVQHVRAGWRDLGLPCLPQLLDMHTVTADVHRLPQLWLVHTPYRHFRYARRLW